MSASLVYRITVDQAVAAFQVSYSTITNAVRSGSLPAIKPQRAWLLKPEDVEEWLVELDAKRIAASE